MKATFKNSIKSTIMIIPDFLRKYSSIRKVLNIFFLIVLCLVAWQFRKEVMSALKLSITIGWGFLVLPVLFIVWNTFATKGWQVLLNRQNNSKRTSFLSLFLLRLQSQALNQVLPVSGIGGEALRSLRTRENNGLKNSTLIVAVDKIIDVAADFVIAIAGILIAFSVAKLNAGILILLGCILALLIGIILFWKVILKATTLLIKSERYKETLNSLLNTKKIELAIVKSFTYHFLEHILMMMEIYIVARFVGIELGMQQLLYCNAIGTLFNLLFIAVPARAGAFECSLAFAFSQIGFSTSAGISVALIRRARQILVCFCGLALFFSKNKMVNIPIENKNMSTAI